MKLPHLFLIVTCAGILASCGSSTAPQAPVAIAVPDVPVETSTSGATTQIVPVSPLQNEETSQTGITASGISTTTTTISSEATVSTTTTTTVSVITPSSPENTTASPTAATGIINGYVQNVTTGWWFPVETPEFKVQKLDTILIPDAVTARLNAEGGWQYWHTYRTLPGGIVYFFVVGPTKEKDQAGWYANFQIPAVEGSGAWLATVLLETTSAKPQAFGGLADMYKGIVKTTGVPEGTPRDIFKAAADGFSARKTQAPSSK